MGAKIITTETLGQIQEREAEEWLAAITALGASSRTSASGKVELNPDFKPLAALLRSRRPIPESTIDMLADLLDPPAGDPLGCRLKLVETRDIVEDFEKNSNMVAEYEKQYKIANEADEIRPHEVAKDYAAQKFGKSESTIDRARRAHASLFKLNFQPQNRLSR
ncbi:MAG: hypothetical protein ABSD90_15510 [Methylocystis sp.]|jgi:hypothetical protein